MKTNFIMIEEILRNQFEYFLNLFVRTLTISNRVLFESSLAIKYLTFGRLSAIF